ncbi:MULTISPECIES: polysaccharide deacetylase family protein [Thermotoga]|jgi:peptidoglycan/xylan/chitin deacetylase (PgdA/CDA1 family)|uniref:Polysaccharide deacetylase n=3 Tax=Thermotoga petrophila TaxID=93929 RepID=A5IKV7_THEP1|nr:MULTISPECIES: polysaccharide deacetylase family protein [Thermotoga]KUK23740.1 MAG: Polysaccharide deacetylase [Thermotoga petrophila]KUK34000.1 MAG: Polysaccharide deacetylase [Thermotoga sp. 47_83]MDK2893320.1 peptidoglycan-N-acetylglucosamine deacetylase [Thermotoga sp.]ABQ46830.1 polysaccharide deacetylase [Thermotoga petrophila RKU-1]ADA66838.1 polysaccharide deacetylase [Thermotoga petrophila RKU-10]
MKRLLVFLSIFLTTVLLFSIDSKVNSKEENGVKLVALTFDDGPDVKLTSAVLDTLEKHGVVATFFVVGQRLNESTRAILERMISMGCEIGNHSWNYEPLDKKDPETIKDHIERTNELIKKYAGKEPRFFRPPNLAVSGTMFDVINMPFVSGVLGYDWAGCDRDPQKIVNNVLKGVRDGAIILLHDVQPEPHPIVEVLEILIPELKKRGYEFVTLSELFKRKGVNPEDPVYRKKMWVYVE